MSTPLRVVDITGFFSSACGGIKTYYLAKAAHLPARGVDCHFVAPGLRNEAEPFGGGTLHRVAGPRMPIDHNYRLFGDLPRLCRLIAELEPDVIEIASHYLLPALVARGIRGARRRPMVVGFYHADVPNAYVAQPLRRFPALRRAAVEAAWRWVRGRHRAYARTLVASRVVARALEDHHVPGVTWVGLGVDTAMFRPDAAPRPATPTVVYIGRLTGEKGFRTLLGAWDAIARATGARLVVAGSGPLATEIPPRRDICPLGYVADRAALARVYAAADVVVVPGAFETFSLTTAEALASGTPVVCPDQGAAAELVVDSGCGATFASHDAASLARETIALLRRSGADRAVMGRAGRAHVERRFTWPAACDRILAAYRS